MRGAARAGWVYTWFWALERVLSRRYTTYLQYYHTSRHEIATAPERYSQRLRRTIRPGYPPPDFVCEKGLTY